MRIVYGVFRRKAKRSAPRTRGSFQASNIGDALVIWRLGGISDLIQFGAEFRTPESKSEFLTEQFQIGVAHSH